jgi:hypothetical protein
VAEDSAASEAAALEAEAPAEAGDN